MKMTDRPSPNHDARPPGTPVDILLMHYTGMKTAAAALDRLCDPAAKVSAHYVVEEDGAVHRLVAEDRRAWHAGVAHWAGSDDINARSIGIEIVNPGHEFGYRDFPDAQIEAVIALSRDILARHSIPPRRVLGHSDVAPARKQDPGEKFPWARLAAEGVGLWPDVPAAGEAEGPTLGPGDRGETVRALQAGLRAFGYGLADSVEFDEATRLVVTAFQRHFQPEAIGSPREGRAEPALRAVLRALTGR